MALYILLGGLYPNMNKYIPEKLASKKAALVTVLEHTSIKSLYYL